MAVPMLWIRNVTVSPTTAWTSPGVKLRLSSPVSATTRGAALVPGVKARTSGVGVATAAGLADGPALAAADGGAEAPVGPKVQVGLVPPAPQAARANVIAANTAATS